MAETPALAAALAGAAQAGRPAHLGLMHVLMAADTEGDARAGLQGAILAAQGEARQRLEAVQRVWAVQPQAWGVVRAVLAEARHDVAAEEAGAAVARWAKTFDQLAADRPEAGVALYALGDPALLAAASAEIVDALAGWGLLGPDRAVLDLGCGIGRLTGRLASRCGLAVGADVSGGMLAEAARRSGPDRRASYVQVTGRDLRAFRDEAFDLVLAVDVFPYLVQAGEGLARDGVAEAARALRPGGALVVANLSYRGDDGRDAADLAAWADEAGLRKEAGPERPFALWDGLVFRYRKDGRR
ncbi:class I SAM-dependent methyltransferase [Alsobacter sp. KACC 23698]|uniref:Class I SAM-dependent methyltransferase n=1 Tax=Alsobacter sp. KACC 23698 TaxID=3149229 RepID=A0AAU7JDV1_9HYPH